MLTFAIYRSRLDRGAVGRRVAVSTGRGPEGDGETTESGSLLYTNRCPTADMQSFSEE